MERFASDTEIVHGIADRRLPTKDLVPPIHMTATFTFDDCDQGRDVFRGTREGYAYTRVSNPTVDMLQEKMAHLEAGEDAIATASGMAAIASTAMALTAPGDNFVSCSTLYGGTFALLKRHLDRLGISGRFVSPAAGNLYCFFRDFGNGARRFIGCTTIFRNITFKKIQADMLVLFQPEI